MLKYQISGTNLKHDDETNSCPHRINMKANMYWWKKKLRERETHSFLARPWFDMELTARLGKRVVLCPLIVQVKELDLAGEITEPNENDSVSDRKSEVRLKRTCEWDWKWEVMELQSRNAMTDESVRTPKTKEPNFVWCLRKDSSFAIRFNFVFFNFAVLPR